MILSKYSVVALAFPIKIFNERCKKVVCKDWKLWEPISAEQFYFLFCLFLEINNRHISTSCTLGFSNFVCMIFYFQVEKLNFILCKQYKVPTVFNVREMYLHVCQSASTKRHQAAWNIIAMRTRNLWIQILYFQTFPFRNTFEHTPNWKSGKSMNMIY